MSRVCLSVMEAGGRIEKEGGSGGGRDAAADAITVISIVTFQQKRQRHVQHLFLYYRLVLFHLGISHKHTYEFKLPSKTTTFCFIRRCLISYLHGLKLIFIPPDLI